MLTTANEDEPDIQPITKEQAKKLLSQETQKLVTEEYRKEQAKKHNPDALSALASSNTVTIEDDIGTLSATRADAQQSDANNVIEQAKNNNYEMTPEDLQKMLQQPDFQKFASDNEDVISQSMNKAADANMMENASRDRYPKDVAAYIAVSSSMPEYSLEALFTEVAFQYNDRKIVIAIAGIQQNDKTAVQRMMLLLPKNLIDTNFIFVIDPVIFNTFEIDRVPFFVMKTDLGWRKIVGDVSFSEAERYAAMHYDEFRPIATTYPIAEPNMLELVNEANEKFDWEGQMDKAIDNLPKERRSKVSLPVATASYEYHVDPTVTLTQNLEFEGVRIGYAGQTINPLAHQSLANSFAFIDAGDPLQLKIAKEWKKQHPNLVVVSTLVPNEDTQTQLFKELGYIRELHPMLVERFGLEKIPSLAVQDKLLMKITVQAPAPETKENPFKVTNDLLSTNSGQS
jgi:hypothetical protein